MTNKSFSDLLLPLVLYDSCHDQTHQNWDAGRRHFLSSARESTTYYIVVSVLAEKGMLQQKCNSISSRQEDFF